jgi:hypothetical protein
MSLIDTFRSGVATVDKVTKDLQPTIRVRAWTGADAYGAQTYAATKSYRAIVDLKQQERKTLTGKIVMVRATITLLQPISANGATGRLEPVDPRDIVTLPDGTTGPIVDVGPGGIIDPATGHPLFSELYLG